MASPQIDDLQLSSLVAEGLSQNEIARRLGVPRSTIRNHLKKLELPVPYESPAPPPADGPDPQSTQSIHDVYSESAEGIPDVYTETTQSIPDVYKDMLVTMMNDLQEVVVWWQERKATLQKASDATRETERTTFHVERRWIDAIRRQADLDGLTYTQIVNEAFRRYFEGK